MKPSKDKQKPKIFCLASQHDTVMWLVKRIAYHGIIWARETGEVIIEDIDGQYKTMKRNHLKCIIRRDYLEAHGPFPGIDALLEQILDFAQHESMYGEREGNLIDIAGELDA